MTGQDNGINKKNRQKLVQLKVYTAVTIQAGDAWKRNKDLKDGVISSKMAAILEGIETNGALLKTTKDMKIAYSWAWKALKMAEKNFGFALTKPDGARGSTLTPEGRKLLAVYKQVLAELGELTQKRFKALLESGVD